MPTIRRRVVNQQKNNPPVAHCNNTVAASRRITNLDDTRTTSGRHRFAGGSTYARTHMRPARSISRLLVSIMLGSTLLGACQTGQRATLGTAAAAVSDPAITAVLGKLESASVEPLTATYSLLTKFGNVTTPASVAVATPKKRSITIGQVRFITLDSGSKTCQLATGSCSDGINDALVSDKSLTHDFSQIAPAARLRQDAAVMAGAALASTREIAGQTATCVEVPFSGTNVKIYCALDNGLLAFQDTPDLTVTLLGIAGAPDQSYFAVTAP